jgi:hypothetical protein
MTGILMTVYDYHTRILEYDLYTHVERLLRLREVPLIIDSVISFFVPGPT